MSKKGKKKNKQAATKNSSIKKISKNQIISSHKIDKSKIQEDLDKKTQQRKTKSVSSSSIKLATHKAMMRQMQKTGSYTVPSSSNVAMGTSAFFSLEYSTDAFELPRTDAERHYFYRHFYQNDEIVGRAVDLSSDLPMSRIRLTRPNGPDEEQNKKILKHYERMCDNINLFARLLEISHEYNLIGNVYPFHEYDEKTKMWSKIVILNPDNVEVKPYPFTDEVEMSLVPNQEMKNLVKSPKNVTERKLVEEMPDDIVNNIRQGNNIPLDTDKFSGSYAAHIARKKSQYEMKGTSTLQRVLRTLLYREKLRQAQVMIASRNMTPKHLIYIEDKVVGAEVIEDLRAQVDLAMESPDFAIVASCPVRWEILGSNDRLLELSGEWEETEKRLMVGLGFTKEILTGEGLYSGGQVSLEILNTQFLLFREILRRYVEECVFLPIAKANDFYEDIEDENGNKYKKYIYPSIQFNRLNIKDMDQVFDALYNLYSKGSLPVDYILEIFNIDPNEVDEKLRGDVFSLKDSTTNDLIRAIQDGMAEKFANHPEIIAKITKALGLKKEPKVETEPEDEGRY